MWSIKAIFYCDTSSSYTERLRCPPGLYRSPCRLGEALVRGASPGSVGEEHGQRGTRVKSTKGQEASGIGDTGLAVAEPKSIRAARRRRSVKYTMGRSRYA